MNALQIEKETVHCLSFPNQEVLETVEAKKTRNQVLNRASILGNIDHTKMIIIFKDNEGLKKVHTTVWGVTDKYVILKGASLIPLHRVVKVY